MWQVASEAYAYLAGHPFLTDTVLHNGKTDNDRHTRNMQQQKSVNLQVSTPTQKSTNLSSLCRPTHLMTKL